MEGIVRLGFGSEFEAEGEYLDGDIIETDRFGRPIRVRSSATGRMWELRYATDEGTEVTEAEPIA
jgi:hypothetical protein